MEKHRMKHLLLILGMIFILFLILMAKKINFGNTISKQTEEIVDDILKQKEYTANLEITITDQEKNITSVYEAKQTVNGENYHQTVKNRQNNEVVEMEYQNGNLKVVNANLNLEKSYQNYHNQLGNHMFLTTFLTFYAQKDNSRYEEEDTQIILEATDPSNDMIYNQKLYIDKKTQKPTKIVLRNSTGKEVINIKYNDIDFHHQ